MSAYWCELEKIKKAFFNLRRKHFLISWVIGDLLCCGINLSNDTNILLWIKKRNGSCNTVTGLKNCAKCTRTQQDFTSASKAFLRVRFTTMQKSVKFFFVLQLLFYVDFVVVFFEDDPFLMDSCTCILVELQPWKLHQGTRLFFFP